MHGNSLADAEEGKVAALETKGYVDLLKSCSQRIQLN
jgi:hypothetical protein